VPIRLTVVMATINRIAARARHRVLTLSEIGLTEAAVRHLVGTERIWRVYRGVYALWGPLTPLGWAYAAARACEPDAFACRFTAAAVLDQRDHWPNRPQVTIVGRNGATGPNGIEVHHARQLEVGTAHGIPVTSPAQTVIDCAPSLNAEALKSLLRRAEYRGLDLAALERPGLPRQLRALLDRYVIGSGLTDTEIEARFYEVCASAGLPLPEIQARFPERRRVDFVWHDAGVIVETDGRRGHSGFVAIAEDQARDRDHLVDGYVTLRFTWHEVEHESELVARQVGAVLSRRSRRR
jgi:Protein of unknown function (DUF559)